MPSGSHSGGGGGSHFGGGNSGGSHFGGSSSRSGRSTTIFYSPRVFVWGRNRYTVTGQKQASIFALFVVMIIGIFAIFSGGLILSGAKQSINTIEQDYARYQQMITNSYDDTSYQIKGVVTDSFKNEDCDKYYITYAFPIDTVEEENLYSQYLSDLRSDLVSAKWVEGYSFSVYTLQEASAFTKGSIITLALNDKNTEVNSTTDSIPVDYLEMPIEKDGEYLTAKSSKKTGPIVISIGAIVVVACIVGEVFVIKSIKKEPVETTASTSSSTPIDAAKPNVRKCSYCGATIAEDATKCPNCGGSQN